MATFYVGQIIAVGFNFTPTGFLPCDGSLVSISEYETLYNLLGTTYGGNGTTTFGLPNLQGRTPISMGSGPGLSPSVIGQSAGTENVTLTASQNGAHSHPLLASGMTATQATPVVNQSVLAVGSQTNVSVYAATPTNTTLANASIGQSPGGVPHENLQPFLTINYVIAAYGIYPSPA